jgi:hypothetical protein
VEVGFPTTDSNLQKRTGHLSFYISSSKHTCETLRRAVDGVPQSRIGPRVPPNARRSAVPTEPRGRITLLYPCSALSGAVEVRIE